MRSRRKAPRAKSLSALLGIVLATMTFMTPGNAAASPADDAATVESTSDSGNLRCKSGGVQRPWQVCGYVAPKHVDGRMQGYAQAYIKGSGNWQGAVKARVQRCTSRSASSCTYTFSSGWQYFRPLAGEDFNQRWVYVNSSTRDPISGYCYRSLATFNWRYSTSTSFKHIATVVSNWVCY